MAALLSRKLNALQTQVDLLNRLQSETAAELDALLPAILDRAFKANYEPDFCEPLRPTTVRPFSAYLKDIFRISKRFSFDYRKENNDFNRGEY